MTEAFWRERLAGMSAKDERPLLSTDDPAYVMSVYFNELDRPDDDGGQGLRLSQIRSYPGYDKARERAISAVASVRRDPPVGIAEKVADVSAGVVQFIGEMALLRKVAKPLGLPPMVEGAAAMEIAGSRMGKPSGEGAALYATLHAIGSLPGTGVMGHSLKTFAAMTAFGGTTLAAGGTWEDAAVSAGVALVMRLPNLRAGWRNSLNSAKTASQQKSVLLSMRAESLKTLGLGKNPTQAEIKAAFRANVKTTHPDVSGGKSDVAYREAVSAYEFLTGDSPTYKAPPSPRPQQQAAPPTAAESRGGPLVLAGAPAGAKPLASQGPPLVTAPPSAPSILQSQGGVVVPPLAQVSRTVGGKPGVQGAVQGPPLVPVRPPVSPEAKKPPVAPKVEPEAVTEPPVAPPKPTEAAPAPEGAPVEGKYAWEMTREGYVGEGYIYSGKVTDLALRRQVNEWQRKVDAMPDSEGAAEGLARATRKLNLANEHQRAVEQAVKEGKPVPKSVLADYPDLKPPAAKEPAKPDFTKPNPMAKVGEGATDIPHFIQNQDPKLPRGHSTVTSEIVLGRNKGRTAYRLTLVDNGKGNRYVNVEREVDTGGSMDRVEVRFDKLTDSEIEKSKWLNEKASSFFEKASRETEGGLPTPEPAKPKKAEKPRSGRESLYQQTVDAIGKQDTEDLFTAFDKLVEEFARKNEVAPEEFWKRVQSGPVTGEALEQTGLFGQQVAGPIAGKQKALGLEAEAPAAPPAVPVKPALVKAVASLVSRKGGPRDAKSAYLEIKKRMTGKAERLFKNPTNPMPEMESAFEQATKGGLLFQGARGKITFDRLGNALIELKKGKADPTTVVHEFGHLVLSVPNMMTTDEHAALANAVGAKAGKPYLNWTRKQKEAAATLFEEYYRRGKAPTPRLKALFIRIAAMFRRIYSKMLTKLPRDVRAIFDRMHGAKTTLADKKALQVAKTQARSLKKEILAWYEKAAGESIEAIQERAGAPAIQLEDQPYVQEGFTAEFGGKFPGEVKDLLREMNFGQRQAIFRAGLRQNVPGGMAEDFIGDLPGGYNEWWSRLKTLRRTPAEAESQAIAEAQSFAEAVGDVEILAAIRAYRDVEGADWPIKDLAEFRTNQEQQILKQAGFDAETLEQGPVPLPGVFQDPAEYAKAIIKGERDVETRAKLRKVMRLGRLDMQATQKDMRELLNVLPADQRGKALAALNRVTGPRAGVKPFIARVNAILEHLHRKEAHRAARKRYDKAMKTLGDRGLLRPEVQEAFDALRETYAEVGHTDKLLDRMRAIRKTAGLVSLEPTEGQEVGAMPDPIVKQAEDILAEGGRRSLATMSTDEINIITDAILHLARWNELKNHYLLGGQYRDATEAGMESAGDVRKGREVAGQADFATGVREERRLTWIGRLVRMSENLDTMSAWVTHRDSIANRILAKELMQTATNEQISTEREQFEGMQEVILDSTGKTVAGYLRSASREYARIEKGLLRKMVKAWTYGKQILQGVERTGTVKMRTIKLPSARRAVFATGEGFHEGERVKTLVLTPAELMDLVNQFVTPKNRDSLLAGAPLHLVNKGRFEGNLYLTERDMAAIIQAATPAERAIAAYVKGEMNGRLKEKGNAASVTWKGYELLTEEDYYDRSRAGQFRVGGGAATLQQWQEHTLEGNRRLKKRTGGLLPIEGMDIFSRYISHVNFVARFAAWIGPIRQANMLLSNPDFAGEVSKHYAGDYIRMMKQATQTLEDPSGGPKGTIANIITSFIGNMYKGTLGIRPHISGYQFLSFPFILREVDARDVLAGLVSGRVDYDEIMRWSPQTWARFSGSRTGLVGPAASGAHLHTSLTPRRAEWMMANISWADRKTLGQIWQVAKHEVRRKQSELKGDDFFRRVADRFEELVLRTQPAYILAGRSFLGMEAHIGKIGARLLTLFGAVREKIFNQAVMDIIDYRDSDHGPKAKAKFVKNSAILLTNFVLLEMMFRAWRRARGKEDEEGTTFLGSVALGALKRAFSSFLGYGVGDLVGETVDNVIRAWKGLRASWETVGSDPITGALNDAQGFVRSATRAAKKRREGEDATKEWRRASSELLRALSVLGGVPLTGMKDIAEAVIHIGGLAPVTLDTIKDSYLDLFEARDKTISGGQKWDHKAHAEAMKRIYAMGKTQYTFEEIAKVRKAALAKLKADYKADFLRQIKRGRKDAAGLAAKKLKIIFNQIDSERESKTGGSEMLINMKDLLKDGRLTSQQYMDATSILRNQGFRPPKRKAKGSASF